MLLFVVVAVQADRLLEINYLRDAVCLGFCANEMLSIVENLGLAGVPLPVTVETERFRFYETVPAGAGIAAAEQAAGAALQAYLEELVAPYGEVKAAQFSSRQRGTQLFVTLRAECEEQIGQSVPIYTEESGEPPA